MAGIATHPICIITARRTRITAMAFRIDLVLLLITVDFGSGLKVRKIQTTEITKKAQSYTKILCESLCLLGDFYGSYKSGLIIFFIHAVGFYTHKNATYQLITHSIKDTEGLFTFG